MADEADRLKQAREKAGYSSAKAAAEAMGVPVATYIQHENGSRGFKAKAERYAQFFRIAPEWLLYGRHRGDAHAAELGPRLYVKAQVEAGVWKDAWEYDADEWEVFTGRSDVSVPLRRRFGLRVAGESMGEIYPPGTILECVEYDQNEPIPDGKRVVVQRWRFDGSVETTVKELRRDPEGVEWLVPRSLNPSFRPFRGDRPDDSEVEKIAIIAIVVASIRPE